MAFQSIQGPGFTVTGAGTPGNVALVSAMASASLSNGLLLSVNFDGEFGAGYDSLAGALSVSHSF